MKTLLILVLVIALGAGAFMSKPTQADFQTFIRQQQGQTGGLSLKGILKDFEFDSYVKTLVFHDRVFWVTVEKDGQKLYVGAFTHWFKQSAPAPASS